MKLVKRLLILGALVFPLASCGRNSETTIRICASLVPHAKILNEAIKPILKEKGYDLIVDDLKWTLQNDALAAREYDANYFQHIPYLNTYEGSTKLIGACKVHYEKLCVYKGKDANGILENGESIELVNDPSNVERALKLLESHNILTINPTCYDAQGNFVNFNVTNPNSSVTFASEYDKCTLTCIEESQLCISLPDFNFGIIPGNTALTGLGNEAGSRIVLSEFASEEMISTNANIIAVREEDKYAPKTKALVEAFADPRVESYISNFGEAVLYHYENLID